jgi:hypothetical protein
VPGLNHSPRDITSALERKLEIAFRDDKERVGWFIFDGKKQLRFTIPHVHAAWGKGTIASIRRSSHLDASKFDDLITCPLSRVEYEAIIREVLPRS